MGLKYGVLAAMSRRCRLLVLSPSASPPDAAVRPLFLLPCFSIAMVLVCCVVVLADPIARMFFLWSLFPAHFRVILGIDTVSNSRSPVFEMGDDDEILIKKSSI